MKVLVTGASGFIGNATVAKLVDRGHEVTAMVRTHESAQRLAQESVSLVVGDVRDPRIVRGLNVDAVFHLASARTEDSFRKSTAYEQADVVGSRNLVESLDGTTHLLYASTAWVYGGSRDLITEDTPVRPLVRIAEVKVEVERNIQRTRDWTIFRAGMVYPGGGFERQILGPIRDGAFRRPGNGKNYTGLVWVEDLADALVRAAEERITGVFNMVDDVPIQWAQMCGIVAQAVGRPAPAGLPLWLVRLAKGGDVSRFVGANLRISNEQAKSAGFTWRAPVFSSAFPWVLAGNAAEYNMAS